MSAKVHDRWHGWAAANPNCSLSPDVVAPACRDSAGYSVWIDHLRQGDAHVVSVLGSGLVLAHPFVVSELACGQLKSRAEILGLLAALPQATVTQEQEVLLFIEHHGLMGQGIGYIDAHLLAARL